MKLQISCPKCCTTYSVNMTSQNNIGYKRKAICRKCGEKFLIVPSSKPEKVKMKECQPNVKSLVPPIPVKKEEFSSTQQIAKVDTSSQAEKKKERPLLKVACVVFFCYGFKEMGFPLFVPSILISICWLIFRKMLQHDNQKAMLSALSIQGGQILWALLSSILLKDYIGLIDVAIMAIGLTWLIKRPGITPVIYLTAVQLLNSSTFLYKLSVTIEKPEIEIISVKILLSIAAVTLMFLGLRKLKHISVEISKTVQHSLNTTKTDNSPEYPTILRRYLATSIDGMLILVAIILSTYVFDGNNNYGSILRFAIILSIFLIYEPFCTSKFCTVGQKLMRIRIRDVSTNERISLIRAYIRIFVKTLLGCFSLFSLIFSKTRRAIHDFASGSIVVNAPSN